MVNNGEFDLKSYLPRFNLTSFREGQEEVISTVLSGRDCLCVMPTGGGKSLCYQLPALALDGLTLVVSPLIALMKDQVDQLCELGLPVTFINSTLSLAEQYERLERMAAGEFRLVYVVPERFRSQRFIEAVSERGVKLLAIDEAHCVSEWGHDFRPDYARLGYFRRKLGHPPTIALTATATDAVRRDIVEQLDLVDPKTFITGFARDNLFYEVKRPQNDREKGEMLVRFLNETPGSGIVYASTRKKTEEVAELINASVSRPSITYHAGMAPDERRRAQEDFMSGKVEIVVATNAFGMGIDKADVRFVVHYNMPGTLEAYYQEAGRAGRDGRLSKCLLLYTASDRFVQEFFIDLAYPGRENVAPIYEYLRRQEADPIELTQQEIKDQLGLSIGADGVGTCEQLLAAAGVLERLTAAHNMAAVRLDSDLPTLVDLLPKQAKTRRRVLQAVENIVGARRDELVAFNPIELQRATELPHNSITAALRQLVDLEPFTYIPPFRGRAIRMVRRDLPFEKVEIDFEALERRKEAEHAKLRKVISFALSERCRQATILRYFGEQNAQPCGHCDNCKGQKATGKPSASGETLAQKMPDPLANGKLLEAVRIALSGVARVQKEIEFDCGKNLIAQMLWGSNSARIKKLGLNRLSTFGLLKHLLQTEVSELLEGLIAMDLLRQVSLEPGRPVVHLTEAGTKVMSGKSGLDGELFFPDELILKIVNQGAARADDKSPAEDFLADSHQTVDTRLLERLHKWRARRCSEAGLPAYCILHNTTLEEIARQRPDTPCRLEAVKGMGPKRVEQYGRELLAVVAESNAQADSDSPLSVANGLVQDQTMQTLNNRPDYYWTWRLLVAGFSSDECAVIRGLTRKTILGHALQAVENGHPMQLEWFFTQEQLLRFRSVVGGAASVKIADILPKLPNNTLAEEVQLFLNCDR